MAAHRLWLGALLTTDEAVERLFWALLEDEGQLEDLTCCGEWLLASAETELPLCSWTRQLVHLLAASATLDGEPN